MAAPHRAVAHVECGCSARQPPLPQGLDSAPASRITPVQRHVRAVCGERLGHREPEAARAARDQRYLTIEREKIRQERLPFLFASPRGLYIRLCC
jgi:hypothetical protein